MAHSQVGGKPQTKVIWRTFWILLGLTALEFAIAFTIGASMFRNVVFIGLTLVKAFYIVAEFMHLKHEAKVLMWSIVLPIIFIVWLLVALLVEGEAIINGGYF